MRTTVLTFLMLFVCAVQTIGQDSGNQSNAHRLSYEEVLARWDHARAFGEARTLPEYCRYMNDLFDTDVYSAGLNDGPWIRFYARGEETFGDATGYVFFGAAVFILFCAWRYLREPLQRAFAPAGPGQTDIPPPSTAISQRDADLCGIGGWLLFLCIWTTIIWPVSAFANLHEVRDDWMYVFVGLILFSIVSGISLWREARNGLVLVRTFLWIILALNSISMIASGSARPDLLPVALCQSAIPAAWLIYLHRSRRVRATFGAR